MTDSIQLLDHLQAADETLKFVWSLDIDATGKFLSVPFCNASNRVTIAIFDLTKYWNSTASASSASATSEAVEKKNTAPLVSFDVKDLQGSLMYCFSIKFHPKKKLIAGAGGTSIRVFSWKQENTVDNNDNNNDDDNYPNNENFKEILKIDGKHKNLVHEVLFSNNGLFCLTSSFSDCFVWNSSSQDWSVVHSFNTGSYWSWVGDDRKIPQWHLQEEESNEVHFCSPQHRNFYRIVKKKNETSSSEFSVETIPFSDFPSFGTDIVANHVGEALSYSPQTRLFSMKCGESLKIIDTNHPSSFSSCSSSPSSWKMLLDKRVGSSYSHSSFSPEGASLLLWSRFLCQLHFFHQTDSREPTSWKSVFASDSDSGIGGAQLFDVKQSFRTSRSSSENFKQMTQLFFTATSQHGIFACGTDVGVTIHYAKFLSSFWERRKYLLLISEFSNLTHLKQALEMYVVKRNVAKFL